MARDRLDLEHRQRLLELRQKIYQDVLGSLYLEMARTEDELVNLQSRNQSGIDREAAEKFNRTLYRVAGAAGLTMSASAADALIVLCTDLRKVEEKLAFAQAEERSHDPIGNYVGGRLMALEAGHKALAARAREDLIQGAPLKPKP